MQVEQFEILRNALTYEFDIPLVVALHHDLTIADLRVYFVISKTMDKEDTRSISNKRIAEILEMQPGGVQESIDRLTSLDLINVYFDENENGSYNRIIEESETAYDLYGEKNDDFYRRLHEVEEE